MKSSRLNRREKVLPTQRRGVATVEMAVILPVLLLIVFGTIELCTRLFIRQSAAVTAYEGARLAARRTVTSDRVLTRCQSLLAGRNIENAIVTIVPEDTSAVATGELIQVRVEVPWQGNTPSTFALPNAGSIVVTASMLRE